MRCASQGFNGEDTTPQICGQSSNLQTDSPHTYPGANRIRERAVDQGNAEM